MMKNHGLRRFFSLLLAVFMVCTLLPTAALAEDTTGADETQSKTVVEEQQDVPPPVEDGKKEDEAVTPDGENDVQPESDLNSDANQPVVVFARDSSGITISASCIGALFLSGSTGEHTVKDITRTVYITRDDIGSKNAKGSAVARFTGSNEAGWTLVIDLEIGNYKGSIPTNARITNKDMSKATGRVTFGVTAGKDVATHITIMGASSLPDPAPDKPRDPAVMDLLMGNVVNVHCTNTAASHADAAYPLKDNSFTVGDVQGNPGNYTCVVTVYADQHVTAYGDGHTLASANESTKTITLKYNETAKKWERPSSLPITFNVACDNAVPPVAPSEAEVAAMDIWVTVSCTKNPANHSDRMSRLTVESIVRIGDVQTNPVSGEYTCTVEVNSSDYVTQFDKTHGYAVHRPTGKSGYIDLTYSKEANRWVAPASPYNVITFQVKCVTSPTFNDLKTIFNQNIHVDCTTKSTHTEALYDLIENSYVIDDYTTATDNPTCTVIIRPWLYVDEYNTSFGAHATDSEGKSVALYYADNGWTAAEGAVPVVFKVKCNTEIVPPHNPTDEELAKLEAPVEVVCTAKPETHTAAQFSLRKGTYTIGNVVGNETDGYACDITVTADRYVAWYNLDYGKHTLTGDNTKTLTLKYVEGQWAVDTPVTFTVICPPTKPGAKDLAKLETAVEVTCTTKPKAHAAAQFSLRYGTYTIGNVAGNETDGYTCDITVTPDDIYVALYNMDYGKHTLTGDNTKKTLKLKYEEGQWAVDTPVTFNVTCVALPTFDKLTEIFHQNIFVECNTKLAHTETPYDLIDGSYTIEDFSTMTDSPTCTVVLHSREYVKLFNGTTKAVHTPEDEVMRVGLVLRDSGWGVANGDLSVVFRVSCVPDAPTDDYLKGLLNEKVKVACTSTTDHAILACDLLDGSYQGSGVQPDGNDGYTYTVTIKAAKYVERYNTKWLNRRHYLVEGEPAEKPVTLVWNADAREWHFANADAVPVIFHVECLTVTYEDGVNGSVFKTVSFPNLKRGEATPTIDDPIRVGYRFAGWEPTVAATVTGDVTYTAQWKKVDTTFTVKYNDNVKGKAFKEQVYEDLEYNEDTPGFDGTPKRSGYTFTGWKPVVADRVTEDVVYYAQWKSNSGKDGVPKTGDGQIVMILGSVLLFSFCGATAVCLNDRKRKQG